MAALRQRMVAAHAPSVAPPVAPMVSAMANPGAAMDEPERPMDMAPAGAPDEAEKMQRHQMLMVKAPSVAARKLHRKLFLHHQQKLSARSQPFGHAE